MFVLRFYGPVNPVVVCWSYYPACWALQTSMEMSWSVRIFRIYTVILMLLPGDKYFNIGIKHGFHALTFARSRGRCWKPRPEAAVFNTFQGTLRMLMHWKTMFDRYYCIKTQNICYISRYFLHYFVSPFHRCLANAISTDYARSRAG